MADKTPLISDFKAGFVDSIVRALDADGKFVLLSGDSGSGRTTICEQVSSAMEPKYQTIFLPCVKDQDPKQLRELFLQQLLPGSKWDLSLNLPDSLLKAVIPGRRKILIIAEDIDKAVSGFSSELETLYTQVSGSGRFAFMASCHPLWAAQALRSTRVSAMEEFPVPLLTKGQSLELARHLYAQAGLSDVFSAVLPTLSVVLERCKGNIGAVIRQTENLMADPKNTSGVINTPGDDSGAKRRRHGAGIFITVICVIIVIACMVPLFMGTDFLSGIFGGKGATQTEEVTATQNTQNGNNSAAQNTKEEASQGQQNAEADVQSNPLRTSKPAVQDLKVDNSAPKGTADEAKQDDGALLPDVGDGIEVKSPDETTKNSVTLRGDTLEKIENSEAGSGKDPGLPRRGVEGSEVNKAAPETKAQDVQKSDDGTLARADNSLRSKEIADENAQLQKEAEEKQQAELKYAQEHKAEAEAALAQQAKAKEIADKAAAALDDSKPGSTAKKTTGKRRQGASRRSYAGNYRYGGGVPGASAELDGKDPNHYSLQVIAGRSRDRVVQASAAVSERYWIYETTREGAPWYVLVSGDYATSADALRAARRLPPALRANRPFAKTFDRIQTEKRLSSNGR